MKVLKSYLTIKRKYLRHHLNKIQRKVYINTVEGVDRALYSELVEVRRKLSEKLNIAPVSIFRITR